MKLLVPEAIVEELKDALRRAGAREVGGVLMGEHVAPNTFRVKRITVQMKGGTFAAFVRLVEEIVGPLREFFHATNHDYSRFNYLGEWHSHHSFALIPSDRDCQTMREILEDPAMGARFVVLMLARLNADETLAHEIAVFLPHQPITSGTIAHE